MTDLVRLWSDSRDLHAAEKNCDSAVAKYEDVQHWLHELQERHNRLVTLHHDLQDVFMDLTEERNSLRTLLDPFPSAFGNHKKVHEAKETVIETGRDAFLDFYDGWAAAITQCSLSGDFLKHQRAESFSQTIRAHEVSKDAEWYAPRGPAIRQLKGGRLVARGICDYCLDCGRV